MASYIAGFDEPDARAERMAELESHILPACKKTLEWPDDLSIDLDSTRQSLAPRKT